MDASFQYNGTRVEMKDTKQRQTVTSELNHLHSMKKD